MRACFLFTVFVSLSPELKQLLPPDRHSVSACQINHNTQGSYHHEVPHHQNAYNARSDQCQGPSASSSVGRCAAPQAGHKCLSCPLGGAPGTGTRCGRRLGATGTNMAMGQLPSVTRSRARRGSTHGDTTRSGQHVTAQNPNPSR